MKRFLAGAAVLAAVSVSAAQVIDGSRDGSYGPALAVQTVETQFGDNFSELDAAYATVSGGVLKMFIAGNLEANFNKLNIFIDSKAGGQNVINAGANPGNDNWANKYHGFTFDTGFSADYMLIFRHGNGGTQFDVDYAVVGGGFFDGGTVGTFDNTAGVGNLNSVIGGNNVNMSVRLDNSNSAGVFGGTNAADQMAAQAVTTGLEFSIPLAAIGSPVGAFNVSVMVNGSNHDYLSNQFLGGLTAPQGNLGGDGAGGFNGSVGGINLNDGAYASGNQYFTVPEPSALALLGLGALAGMIRRR